ncbi:hypothetical protein HCH_01379 [Hahella chejuensis KCTC 2396]|uniref:Uncharacterized protein n=1 Tax=Hahella chejuensis (strain KCTC 2396) TaxID=349521 RepID=Q2SM82_HAHCH|nr:hypothetical protein HCH_01379 [Hahella chejuensis KCTC 2396]
MYALVHSNHIYQIKTQNIQHDLHDIDSITSTLYSIYNIFLFIGHSHIPPY